MISCTMCVHYEVCGKGVEGSMDRDQLYFESRFPRREEFDCPHFKPKSRFVEVKHGEWVKVGIGIAERIACSQCGSDRGSWQKPPFCCDCGAKMDGEKALAERSK